MIFNAFIVIFYVNFFVHIYLNIYQYICCLLIFIIVIDLQIVFINFFILNIICGLIRIVHINSVLIHIQIRCIPEFSLLVIGDVKEANA
jgi:hypothetical protein